MTIVLFGPFPIRVIESIEQVMAQVTPVHTSDSSFFLPQVVRAAPSVITVHAMFHQEQAPENMTIKESIDGFKMNSRFLQKYLAEAIMKSAIPFPFMSKLAFIPFAVISHMRVVQQSSMRNILIVEMVFKEIVRVGFVANLLLQGMSPFILAAVKTAYSTIFPVKSDDANDDTPVVEGEPILPGDIEYDENGEPILSGIAYNIQLMYELLGGDVDGWRMIPVDNTSPFPYTIRLNINDSVYRLVFTANFTKIDGLTTDEDLLALYIFNEDNRMLFGSIISDRTEYIIKEDNNIVTKLLFHTIDLAQENVFGNMGDYGTKVIGGYFTP